MGRFAKVHPDEHRRAIVVAVIDQGMTQPGARKAAEAGELPGCRPFTVSKGTVSSWVALERRARQPKVQKLVEDGELGEMVESVQLRLARVLERDLSRIERVSHKAEVDPRTLERLAVAADRIASMGRNGTGSKAKAKDQAEAKAESESTLLAELATAPTDDKTSSTTTSTANGGGPISTPRARDQHHASDRAQQLEPAA